MKANMELRMQIMSKGLKNWQVADALGIHESNFTRLMRKELPLEKKKEVLEAITRCVNERRQNLLNDGS